MLQPACSHKAVGSCRLPGNACLRRVPNISLGVLGSPRRRVSSVSRPHSMHLRCFSHQASTMSAEGQPPRTSSTRSPSRMQQYAEQLYFSCLEPYVGPVAVSGTPGAGSGLFTTQAVNPGDLLLISKPLATVNINPSAVASGPSKLIQTLLTEMLNPGQVKWLQLLSDRTQIAQQQQLLLRGEVNLGHADHSDLRSDRTFEISSVLDLAEIQGLAAGGGKLDRLQFTPMQLVNMIQECYYAFDPKDISLTHQLMAAAAAAAGSRSAAAAGPAATEACCGLWPEIALMGRSCAPNVTITLAADGQTVLLRAADQMPAGTQLFVSQLQPTQLLLLPRAQRQQHLNRSSGLSCSCSRCTAEENLIKSSPGLLPLLAALSSTAAAATAAMRQREDAQGHDQQQQQQGAARVVLENGGSSVYNGDDWMFEGPAQLDPQAAASSNGSSSRSSNGHVDVGSSTSNRNPTRDVVIAAEYVLIDGDSGTPAAAAAAAAATEDRVAAASFGGATQQQQLEVAFEWLQRLVVNLSDLYQQAAAAQGGADAALLLTAAAGTSWAAVRQALVVLSSSSSSSSNDQLLRTQLHSLLTEAALAPISGSSSSSSSDPSWQDLLIRVHDLETKTLGTIAPGMLYHVLSATAAAATAAAAAQSKSNRSKFAFDHWSNFDQGVCQDIYHVAGDFINVKQRAVAAKFGKMSVGSQHELVAAARLAAVAAGVMPAAAVAAAGSKDLETCPA